MSNLSGLLVSRVELHVPKFGSWRADVTIAGGVEAPTGDVLLTVGDLELHGTVQRSGLDGPGKPRATVIGGAGWEDVLAAPMSYQSDAGVRLSTILRDLSTRAGEPIEQPTDRTIAERFAAPAGTRHRDVLAALQRGGYVPAWRVDPDGVTRFGARAGATVTARADEMRRDAALGIVTLGIDSPASFLPGGVLQDGSVIERIVVRETAGKLEADAWVSDASVRASVLRMVAEAFPVLVYGYPRTYHVAAVLDDGRLDLEAPPDQRRYLPELQAAEQWSLGGAIVTPAVGAEVLVAFRDADPTRYVVLGWAPGVPDALALGGDDDPWSPSDEAGRVVRYGDQIVFPLGSLGTLTALPVTGVAVPPISSTVSRVRA